MTAGVLPVLKDTVIGFIVFLLMIGPVAGFVARALVPGPDPMSIPQTILLGIVGSFVGGSSVTSCSARTATTVRSRRPASSAR